MCVLISYNHISEQSYHLHDSKGSFCIWGVFKICVLSLKFLVKTEVVDDLDDYKEECVCPFIRRRQNNSAFHKGPTRIETSGLHFF